MHMTMNKNVIRRNLCLGLLNELDSSTESLFMVLHTKQTSVQYVNDCITSHYFLCLAINRKVFFPTLSH
jgi:hypothetical protein